MTAKRNLLFQHRHPASCSQIAVHHLPISSPFQSLPADQPSCLPQIPLVWRLNTYTYEPWNVNRRKRRKLIRQRTTSTRKVSIIPYVPIRRRVRYFMWAERERPCSVCVPQRGPMPVSSSTSSAYCNSPSFSLHFERRIKSSSE